MAAIEADITWEGGGVRHRDRLIMPEAALQADGALIRARAVLDTSAETEIDPSRWIAPVGIKPRLLPTAAFSLGVQPVAGRHYPRLAFAGLAEGSRDLRPCRLLASDGEGLCVDLNHPLAGRAVRLTLRRVAPDAARTRFVQLFDGPGMQVPPAHAAASYLPQGALARQDESDDGRFYASPRLVHHLDAVCRAEIARLYGRFLQSGRQLADGVLHTDVISQTAICPLESQPPPRSRECAASKSAEPISVLRVLDLMSSWVSHLPETPADLEVTGLGMNAAELAANARLNARCVHDLNADPRLPFADAAFDLVICTASVEYLTRPQKVFAEVRRVLRPGGRFVLTFSDRWFPPKAIRVWAELHPYERLGLVLWLLGEAGYADLHSETLRGLKRSEDDPYSGERDYSDPLFAAWGTA